MSNLDIRDIKPILGVLDLGTLFFLLLCTAVILAIAYYLFKRIKKRLKAKAEEKAKAKVKVAEKPFHLVAEEAIMALEPLRYYETNRYKEYYFIITEIIRMFLAKNYLIDTLDKTSLEIIEAVEKVEREFEKVKLLERYFQACDLVKFAKQQPTLPEMKEAKEISRKIIKECYKQHALR